MKMLELWEVINLINCINFDNIFLTSIFCMLNGNNLSFGNKILIIKNKENPFSNFMAFSLAWKCEYLKHLLCTYLEN